MKTDIVRVEELFRCISHAISLDLGYGVNKADGILTNIIYGVDEGVKTSRITPYYNRIKKVFSVSPNYTESEIKTLANRKSRSYLDFTLKVIEVSKSMDITDIYEALERQLPLVDFKTTTPQEIICSLTSNKECKSE